jgi:hypothetical protein
MRSLKPSAGVTGTPIEADFSIPVSEAANFRSPESMAACALPEAALSGCDEIVTISESPNID